MALSESQLRILKQQADQRAKLYRGDDAASWPPKVPFGLGGLDPVFRRIIITNKQALTEIPTKGPTGREVERYLARMRKH